MSGTGGPLLVAWRHSGSVEIEVGVCPDLAEQRRCVIRCLPSLGVFAAHEGGEQCLEIGPIEPEIAERQGVGEAGLWG